MSRRINYIFYSISKYPRYTSFFLTYGINTRRIVRYTERLAGCAATHLIIRTRDPSCRQFSIPIDKNLL